MPWSQICSWNCNTCGICCREYDVVLKFPEWLSIVKNFGVEFTVPSLARFFLKRRVDGSCPFLYQISNESICGLQNAKPQACKLWPFKILATPRFGRAKLAAYYYGNRRLFIYVDATCKGLRFGVPTQEFAYSVIPEFVEIALGIRRKQFQSTAIF